MTYDVGYRFAQALDPSGLDTIAPVFTPSRPPPRIAAMPARLSNATLPWSCWRSISDASPPTTCQTEPGCAHCAAQRWRRLSGRRCWLFSPRVASRTAGEAETSGEWVGKGAAALGLESA